MVHEVYICYDDNDKAAADAICHVLEENRIKCWIKTRDVGIGHIAEEVTEAIRNSKVMVLVFSDSAKNSNFVNTEVDIAFTANIPMLVYKIDNAKLEGGLEFFLKNKHWLDAYPNPTSEFRNLIIDTSKLLEKPITEPEISPKIKIQTNTTGPVNINPEADDKNDLNKKVILILGIGPILLFVLGLAAAIFEGMLVKEPFLSIPLLILSIFLAIFCWPILIIYIVYKKVFS